MGRWGDEERRWKAEVVMLVVVIVTSMLVYLVVVVVTPNYTERIEQVEYLEDTLKYLVANYIHK